MKDIFKTIRTLSSLQAKYKEMRGGSRLLHGTVTPVWCILTVRNGFIEVASRIQCAERRIHDIHLLVWILWTITCSILKWAQSHFVQENWKNKNLLISKPSESAFTHLFQNKKMRRNIKTKLLNGPSNRWDKISSHPHTGNYQSYLDSSPGFPRANFAKRSNRYILLDDWNAGQMVMRLDLLLGTLDGNRSNFWRYFHLDQHDGLTICSKLPFSIKSYTLAFLPCLCLQFLLINSSLNGVYSSVLFSIHY